MKFIQAIAAFASILASTVQAQAPNTLAKYNPDLRTQSLNGTFYVIPIPDKDLATVIAPRKLVPLPTSDKSIFPNGFPAGTHPIVVLQGFQNDIRMHAANVPLYIKSLLSASVLVPYVDVLNDGKTPFSYQIGNFISGLNGDDLSPLIPVLVGSLVEGNPIREATADPDDKAYTLLSKSIYSAIIKEVVVPNPVSGPGIYPDCLDMLFSSPPAKGSTSRIFHQALSFPLILPTGMCSRNPYYFNDTFANPQLGKGTVTLYSPALPNGLTGSAPGATAAKQYDGVQAYAAVAQQVGYNPEDCATASKKVDPFAGSQY